MLLPLLKTRRGRQGKPGGVLPEARAARRVRLCQALGVQCGGEVVCKPGGSVPSGARGGGPDQIISSARNNCGYTESLKNFFPSRLLELAAGQKTGSRNLGKAFLRTLYFMCFRLSHLQKVTFICGMNSGNLFSNIVTDFYLSLSGRSAKSENAFSELFL